MRDDEESELAGKSVLGNADLAVLCCNADVASLRGDCAQNVIAEVVMLNQPKFVAVYFVDCPSSLSQSLVHQSSYLLHP